MFMLSITPLEGHCLTDKLINPEAGACVFFEGRVRKFSHGREVVMIEYEAAEKPAQNEFRKIVDELKKNHGVFDTCCMHRIGKVRVGETAVWVGVSATHRDAAFAACRYAIDELKKRLPIWKKEHYADGTSEWLGSEG
jgi:molybdopterin synthase catalytic subunit